MFAESPRVPLTRTLLSVVVAAVFSQAVQAQDASLPENGAEAAPSAEFTAIDSTESMAEAGSEADEQATTTAELAQNGNADDGAATATLAAAAATPGAQAGAGVEEIEVISRLQSTAIAKDLKQYGNQVQVISAEEVEAGGYTNFAELAQGLIAGAYVGYSPDEGEFTIRLDGGGDRDTLVTLDDVPLYDRGPGVEDIWGSTLIDPHMIESVEVFRGGQSLYFGSNAGVGLVSIRTKRPDGTRKGEMGFSYGSFNTREVWGNYSFPLDSAGRHSVMFYGGRLGTDGPDIFTRESQTDNHLAAGGITDYSNSRDDIGAKYLWKIDATSQLLANLQFVQIDFQDTFPNTTIYGPTRSKMPLFNVSYNKTWSEKIRTDITASYRKPELLNTKFLPEVCRIKTGCVSATNPNQVIEWGHWTGRLEPQVQRGIGSNSIPAGFEELIVTALNHITFNPSIGLTLGLQSTNYRDASDPRVRIDGDTVSSNALIADLHVTPSFSPGTSVSIAGRVENEKSFGTETIGKYGLRQALPGNTFVRINGGNSFSLPRTNELYSNTDTMIGNPDLKPEKTKTLNYGGGTHLAIGSGQLQAELGGFATDISNRIQSTNGLTPNTRFNTDAVTEIRGFVADLQFQLGSNWLIAAAYTQQKAEVKGTDRQIDATPEWFATGQLRYTTTDRRWQFNLLPRLQGRTISAAPAAAAQPDYNWGDWFVLNATGQYWAGEKREHRLQLRLENILDEDYSNRGLWGNQQYSSAGVRGEVTPTDPEYYYPYAFQAKPRSLFFTYAYSF